MKSKHLVLRTNRHGSRDIFSGPLSPPTTPSGTGPDVTVQVEELDRREIVSITRDADVVALAPVMPMNLIAPVEDGAATEQAGDLAWGVRAVRADTSITSGDGIVVAVLDTGIQADHPAFQGVELVQRNFTDEDGTDSHGHGTHCAGSIFGRSTSGVRIGVAPGVTKALIGKVLGRGGGSSDQVVSAIQWAAESGAHVISMSLGMDFPGFAKALRESGLPEEMAVSRALEGYRSNIMLFERLVLLLQARPQTTLIVAAAGNESRRDEDARFELAVAPPAAAGGIVSVAAVGRANGGLVVAPFSNTGANICGPGVAITSAALGGGLRASSGTSMATPHAAGVAALWAEQLRRQGSLSVLNLTSKLVGTASFSPLATGVDPFDVGAGLCTAPQT